MKTSEQCKNVLKALFEAKSKFAKAEKSKQNSHLKNRYATLEDVLAAVEPGLEDSGLVMFQSMVDTESQGSIVVETSIYHAESSEYVQFLTKVPISKNDCQGVGSSLTYARRYAITSALGLSQADDDGQLAVKGPKDYKKEIDACETLDILRDIYKAAKGGLDAAGWKVVEPYLAEKGAELKLQAGAGFNPSKPKEVKKVENEPKKEVESQQIEQF